MQLHAVLRSTLQSLQRNYTFFLRLRPRGMIGDLGVVSDGGYPETRATGGTRTHYADGCLQMISPVSPPITPGRSNSPGRIQLVVERLLLVRPRAPPARRVIVTSNRDIEE